MNSLENLMTNTNPEYGVKGIRQASDSTLVAAMNIDTSASADQMDFNIRNIVEKLCQLIPNDDRQHAQKSLTSALVLFGSCVATGLTLAPTTLSPEYIEQLGLSRDEYVDIERKNRALEMIRFAIFKEHVLERMSSEYAVDFILDDADLEAILSDYESVITGVEKYIELINSISAFKFARVIRQEVPDPVSKVGELLEKRTADLVKRSAEEA